MLKIKGPLKGYIFSLGLLFFGFGQSYSAPTSIAPIDSIGLERFDGKLFIIHQVSEKETLYGISRRYNVPILDIVSHNPSISEKLDIGRRLRIPYQEIKEVVSQQRKANEEIHVVDYGETLYAISLKYGVTTDELMAWNKLQNTSLKPDQKLKVYPPNARPEPQPDIEVVITETKSPAAGTYHEVAFGETLYSIAREYGVDVNEVRNWNNLESTRISIGQRILVSPPFEDKTIAEANNPKPDININEVKVVTTPTVSPKPRPDEIIQSGVAALLEGTDNNRKYLALHKTAEVGTILKVRNEMNNREIFVRVLGKLPDTGVNEKLLIKISKAAYEQLGAIDPQFRVQVSYIP